MCHTRRYFVAQMAKFRSLAVEIRPGKRKKNEDAQGKPVCVGSAHLIRVLLNKLNRVNREGVVGCE